MEIAARLAGDQKRSIPKRLQAGIGTTGGTANLLTTGRGGAFGYTRCDSASASRSASTSTSTSASASASASTSTSTSALTSASTSTSPSSTLPCSRSAASFAMARR
ncbi:hypothetical protein DIE16_19225 [Burkholderia sp. Bp9090]|nr:hypothetical protein DIE16_19225 [Burkholderia sp. Bp9090]